MASSSCNLQRVQQHTLANARVSVPKIVCEIANYATVGDSYDPQASTMELPEANYVDLPLLNSCHLRGVSSYRPALYYEVLFCRMQMHHL